MAINSLGYNTQRLSGLFSGMDTQSLVTNMLAADQAKVDNIFRQQEKAQWKLDAYSELNSAVSNLRDTYLSVLGEKSLIKNAAYNNYNVAMSENSSIRITGTASAMPTNFQVLSATRATSARAVNQLAPDRFEANGPAKITGSAKNLSADATIGSLAEQFGLKDGESLSFSINGETFTFNQEQTLGEVMEAVNGNAKANVTMSLDANGAMTIESNASGASKLEFSNITGKAFAAGEKGFGIMQGGYEQGVGVRRSDSLAEVAWKMGVEIGDTFEFSVNGVDFSFDAETATLTDVMNKVNNDPNAKAVFNYSEMTEAFEIRSAETGESAALEITGMEELFGLGGENGAQVDGGKDATLRVDINGTQRTIEQASNTFTLDGLDFEIMNDYDAADGPINVNVERDYQPTIDAVKSFVEDYNKVIESLNTKYYEQSYRAYQPLTEDERAAITEDEAKKWDEKAMSGVLRNDSAIGNLLTNLRQSLMVKVGDTGMSAMDLGISTVAWSSDSWRTKQGQLQLDEEKLLAALKEDPNAVQKVLAGISEDGEVTTNSGMTSESGLLVRMNEFMRSFNTTMRTQNIQTTTKEIANYAEKMTDMLVKMSEKEEKYWAKYSAMETMLAEMQSQQSWLASMLGTTTTA